MNRAHTMNLFAIGLAVAAILTAIWPQWIELVFRVDPDQGSGALEWGLVGLLAVLAVAASLLARRTPRQRAANPLASLTNGEAERRR